MSGQRFWMNRAARETAADVEVTLLPIEQTIDGESALVAALKALTAELSRTTTARRHIYCELPWSVTDDADELEAWIADRPEFADERPTWRLTFVGLCPADVDRLPEVYHRGLEEFARASHSAVVVMRRDGDELDLPWFDAGLIDFGRKTEVFEEDLWPAPLEALTPEQGEATRFIKGDELELFSMPLAGERTSYQDLFEELLRGEHGNIWGAELSWKNPQGDFEALTITQRCLFSWTSAHHSYLTSAPLNGAMLNVAGRDLQKQKLALASRAQLFC